QLKQGRFFTAQDDERSLPVEVIDEAFAHKYFGANDPIGKGINTGADRPWQIVGVVRHVKQWSLNSDETDGLQAQLYLPFRALPDNSLPTSAGVVVRSAGGMGPELLNGIRQVVANQSKQNVVSDPQTMNHVIAESLAQQRFSMILL